VQSRNSTNDSSVCFEWIAANVIVISVDGALPPNLAVRSAVSAGSLPTLFGGERCCPTVGSAREAGLQRASRSMAFYNSVAAFEFEPRWHGRVVGSGNGAWDLGEVGPLLSVSSESASVPSPYPGFHSLPPRTVREVFPHTALRQPSSGGMHSSSSDAFCLLSTSSLYLIFSCLALRHSLR